ncbi:MAG: hypothetical protein OER80_09640 [Gammaproteobacteria bacterium]|nr:hypothetical protein [Gammaproteobacteria bacterium]
MIGDILPTGFSGWIGHMLLSRIFQFFHRRQKQSRRCSCETPPFTYYGAYAQNELGEDSSQNEISISDRCDGCGLHWLVYYIDQPHHTNSGRWWRVKIAAKDLDGFSADMAKSYIEDQEWCLVGGSYYDQGTQRIEGPIRVG